MSIDKDFERFDIVHELIRQKHTLLLQTQKTINTTATHVNKNDFFSFLQQSNDSDLQQKKIATLKTEIQNLETELKELPSNISKKIGTSVLEHFNELDKVNANNAILQAKKALRLRTLKTVTQYVGTGVVSLVVLRYFTKVVKKVIQQKR